MIEYFKFYNTKINKYATEIFSVNLMFCDKNIFIKYLNLMENKNGTKYECITNEKSNCRYFRFTEFISSKFFINNKYKCFLIFQDYLELIKNELVNDEMTTLFKDKDKILKEAIIKSIIE